MLTSHLRSAPDDIRRKRGLRPLSSRRRIAGVRYLAVTDSFRLSKLEYGDLFMTQAAQILIEDASQGPEVISRSSTRIHSYHADMTVSICVYLVIFQGFLRYRRSPKTSMMGFRMIVSPGDEVKWYKPSTISFSLHDIRQASPHLL